MRGGSEATMGIPWCELGVVHTTVVTCRRAKCQMMEQREKKVTDSIGTTAQGRLPFGGLQRRLPSPLLSSSLLLAGRTHPCAPVSTIRCECTGGCSWRRLLKTLATPRFASTGLGCVGMLTQPDGARCCVRAGGRREQKKHVRMHVFMIASANTTSWNVPDRQGQTLLWRAS